MRYEIIVGIKSTDETFIQNSYLDTFEDVSISLNYNIADITDISTKKSSYSKTIDLPDTENNRQVFKYIFDINADLSSGTINNFNPNKKTKCWVLKDGLIQFEGNLQLTNINYNFDTKRFIYQAVIYSDNDNLFKNIGEKFLSDLNLSAYDHSWNYQNVVGSWSASWTNGYYYPLIDYGFPLNLGKLQAQDNRSTQFYPAIYLKTLINQIFTEAEYTYKSDFFNTPFFESLIIPFNNKNLIPSSGILTNQNIIAIGGLINDVDISANNIGNVDWGCITWDQELYDPNGFFDPSTSAYKYIGTQSISQRFTVKFNLRINPGNVTTNEAPWQSWSDNIRLYVVRSKDANGNNVPNWSATPGYFDFINWPTISIGGQQRIQLRSGIDAPYPGWSKTQIPGTNDYICTGIFTTDYINPPLRNQEEVRFFITRSINNQAANPKTQFVSYPIDNPPFFQAEIDPTQASQFTLLEMKNLVPANVKQKDLLVSVFRLFNLYIEPDKESLNTIIIEPKDDYFEKYQTIKDWSNKLDLTNNIDSEILSNTQNRTYIFTYKSDKDYYNSKYVEYNNQTFGEFKYDIDNDFLASDKKIEVIFSPTPLNKLPGSQNIYLPSIFQLNNGAVTRLEGMNIRLLYKSPKFLPTNERIKVDGVEQSIYPYAGYVDDPLNPQVSLNFGQVDSFYSGYSETNNNLVYNYYLNTLIEVSDINSKKITANLYLDSNDINQFKFSDLIYLDVDNMAGYYRVNKIIDYDPSKYTTTKVELLKAYNYNLEFATFSYEIPPCTCYTTMEINYTFGEANAWMANVNSFAETSLQYIIFYSPYNNIPIAYPYPVNENLTIDDLVTYFANNPVQNFSFEKDPNTLDVTIRLKILSLCGSGQKDFRQSMGSTTSSIIGSATIVEQSSSGCNSPNGLKYQQQSGNRISPPKDLVMVGNISTDASNTFTDINNIVSGPDNFIAGYNNIVSGNSNAIQGNSNVINGDNNYNISSNTLILGSSISNTYESSQPSILVGKSIDNYTEGSFLFGNNISVGVGTQSNTITNTFSAVDTPSNGLFIFGNNIEITQPTDSSFIVGNNITLTQSLPSDTFYIGSQTVEINSTQIITNVTGTASFNKMIVGDLVVQDIANNNPGNFRINQYNPSNYPNGSYLFFGSPGPGMEIQYYDYDGNGLFLESLNGSSYYSRIELNDSYTSVIHNDFAGDVLETEIRLGTNYIDFYSINNIYSSFERNFYKLGIFTTNSNVLDTILFTCATGSLRTIETILQGYDNNLNLAYSSKKTATFDGAQIGTTKTIYEETNFSTYSTDLKVVGGDAVISVSAGATQSVEWKFYIKQYGS
jgi:hypothetical protein